MNVFDCHTSFPTTNLNDAQRQAIDDEGHHLLIIAGPGTGKTHTLTHRIAKLMKRLTESQKILAVTFTHKAAEEMKKRLVSRFSCDETRMFVGTFHSFCLTILRQYIEKTKLPSDFKVASPEDILEMTKELWTKETLSQRKKLLERTSKGKIFNNDISMADDILEYNKFLRERGFLDYDDLLVETISLLESQRDVREQLHHQYPFIFVDEYQDINATQHTLLKILVGEKVFLTAIGDPNQAIYGFRGSRVEFFQSFSKDFPKARQLSLQENYRSTQEILQASTQVMAPGAFDVPPLKAHLCQRDRLTLHEAATDKAEAEYVVHQVEKMVGGTSMFSQDSGRVGTHEGAERCFGDIAVLYRLNAQKHVLVQAFERSGIPFQTSGDKFYPQEGGITIQAEKVNLLTLHAAKGLEFPVVFIIGCEENLLPLNLDGFECDSREERRLFYVGMTRAQERLFLTNAKRRYLFGQTFKNQPSSYLNDIESQLKEYEQANLSKTRKKEKAKQINLFS